MKKTNILKVVVIVIAVFVCFFMTACKKNEASATAEATSESVIEADEAEVDESVEESATADETTAPAAEGMYTYTIYEGTENEMTLSMDVNIDDYIISTSYTDSFFSMGQLAQSLGWLPNGDVNFDYDNDTVLYYSYDYGDGTQMVFRGGENYGDSNAYLDLPQIESYSVHLAPSDSYMNCVYSGEIADNLTGITVDIGLHYDDLSIVTTNRNLGCAASRDDIVIIAYIFWSASEHPGENCFYYSPIHESFSAGGEDYTNYYLP